MNRILMGCALLTLAGCGQPADAPKAAEPEPPARVVFEQSVTLAPLMYAVLIPDGAEKAAVEEAARDKCTGENICAVMGWTDRAFLPRGYPMTDREVEAQAFAYRVNRNTGLDEAVWLNADAPSS
jgi:hypothetical protein